MNRDRKRMKAVQDSKIKIVSETPPLLAPSKKTNKKTLRVILLLLGPLVVLAGGGYMYFTGGRYASTDNAYIKADIISVAPEISGAIVTVPVHDNQTVKKGDVLFTIDPASFQIAMMTAQANLATARANIEGARARWRQKQADLKIAAGDQDLARKNYERQRIIQKRNSAAISQTEVDKYAHDLATANQRVVVLQEEQAEILASLDGDPDMPVENHALYKAAQAAVDHAGLNLDRTVVKASTDGTIGKAPKAGDYAHAQVPALSIVGTSGLWVEANFKETDLTRMHQGQPATIKVDTYPGHPWTGTIDSISAASESEFSILPAQNATGNWVKVVQRIPVRIAIKHEDGEPVLRGGMSAEVKVDLGQP
jgi:membrane fusion protein (multidrug efflux system)